MTCSVDPSLVYLCTVTAHKLNTFKVVITKWSALNSLNDQNPSKHIHFHDEERTGNNEMLLDHRQILGRARRGNASPKVTFAPPSFS